MKEDEWRIAFMIVASVWKKLSLCVERFLLTTEQLDEMTETLVNHFEGAHSATEKSLIVRGKVDEHRHCLIARKDFSPPKTSYNQTKPANLEPS
jgi:hypothetical protein